MKPKLYFKIGITLIIMGMLIAGTFAKTSTKSNRLVPITLVPAPTLTVFPTITPIIPPTSVPPVGPPPPVAVYQLLDDIISNFVTIIVVFLALLITLLAPIRRSNAKVQPHFKSERKWVDINSPEIVSIHQQRIAIIVRLTHRKPTYSRVFDMKIVVEPTIKDPIVVSLTAPGFEHLNGTQRPIAIARRGEGECVFDLHPLAVRTSSLQFDFFQKGHLLGNISVPIEIVEHQTTMSHAVMASGHLSEPTSMKAVQLMLFAKVDKRDNETRLLYTLQENGNPGREFQSVTIQGDLATYANQIYEGLNRLTQGQDYKAGIGEVNLSPAKVARQIKTIGRRLWDECLPPDFRTLYTERRKTWRNKTLMIVSDDPYLPWEMVLPYDSDWEDAEPWCLTFQLTRWLRRNPQGNGNEGPPGILPWKSFAVLAPSDSALLYATPEINYFKALTKTRPSKFIEPVPLTWETTLNFFESAAYNWVHLVGHGQHWQVNSLSDAVFMVEGGEGVSPHELNGQKIKSHFSATRPGVVFNICEGARSGWSLSGHSGWANHFIIYGAGLYLAPAWKVSDRLAYQFMETLYTELNNHKTVAEAVRSARRKIRDEQNPAWLAYCVYAHPNAVVQI